MRMLSSIGATSRLVAAAAASFALFAGAAMAQNGYVDVRVRDDSVGCGPVVIKWPADQEEREYDPNPGANDPKLDMAETRPLPVIHHHPSLNAGQLYLPPQDGLYRHYFPESEAPPRLRRWSRAEYEEYLRDHNPSLEIPLAPGFIEADPGAVPATVIVPTGMVTPPVLFEGSTQGYMIVPNKTLTGETSIRGEMRDGDAQPPEPAAPMQTPATVVTPAAGGAGEGTGSFIKLSSVAEKVPFVGPEAVSVIAEERLAGSSSVEVPLTDAPFADAPVSDVVKVVNGADFGVPAQAAYEPIVLPDDGTLKIGKCGTPACR